jgi:regulator of sigma E protease
LSTLLPAFGGVGFTLIAFVLCLSIIVFIHEYGHYIVGRWSGIHAEVFSIGFGPVLFARVDRRGTVWQVAAIPLGGYVRFKGDKGAVSDADTSALDDINAAELRSTMHGAPLWARASTVAAGPIFNFILSLILFFGLSINQGVTKKPLTVGQVYDVPQVSEVQVGDILKRVGSIDVPADGEFSDFFLAIRENPDGPIIDYVVERNGRDVVVQGPAMDLARISSLIPRSAAIEAGLKVGDVITHVNGDPIHYFSDLKVAVEGSNGAPLSLRVYRAGATLDFDLQPKKVEEQNDQGRYDVFWRIGIVSTPYAFEPESEAIGVTEAAQNAARTTYSVMKASITGLVDVVTGAISSCNLSGPIGIAETSGQMARQGGDSLIWFIAVLSTAVGLINLFPIPVLDGGHLVFHGYEAVTGRPPNLRVMNAMMMAGLAIVLSFMMFALFNDVFCP